MYKTILSIAILATVNSLAAQATPDATLPVGLLTAGGSYNGGVSYPFARGIFRYQETHGGWTAGKVRVLKQVSFRRNWSRGLTSSAGPRTNTMNFLVGHGDITKTSNASFSGNFKNGGTSIFGGATKSIAFPDWSKAATSNPEPWTLNIPFSSNFLYDPSKGDFVWESDIVGTTASPSGTYYSDREYGSDGFEMRGGSGSWVPPVRPACNDSAITNTFGAYSYANTAVYNNNYSIARLRGKVEVITYGYYVAPNNADVIEAISLGGYPNGNPGVPAGTFGCNTLKINFLFPYIIVLKKSYWGNSFLGFTGYTELVAPWVPSAASTEAWVQAAWTDSATGQPKLTTARRFTLPRALPPTRPEVQYVYKTSTGTTISGPFNIASVVTGWVTK